ncbi:MAG: enoyl-CoA hydratase/isomerase family protein [Deltaproteobacteria bacterium]|jgi:3-hydroxyacyl-CoA dehydrogenase|nr:enoyl-CoA hydratase/isomerase family protein [Deltaproteobacteria bacterium]
MPRKIRSAAVIGSGIMGGGIAALLAGTGIKTLLLDIVPPGLKEAEKNDPVARNRIVKAGLDTALATQPALFMSPQDATRISIGNLEDDFDKIAECDWIVEVIVENLKIKQDLFRRIEPVRKKDSVVSSNTSGIPLKAMSEGRSKAFKQHFLGTHFFNPVRYMKLLEIIPGEETLSEILEFMADFGERILGKGIVWAKDTPNFVGNRIGVQGMVKVMQLMLEEGVSIPEVDALFGPVMGRPRTGMFKTADIVGLDTLAHVAQNTYELIAHDEDRESFVLPEFVNKMIEKNLLGKKSQSGFYKTELTPDWQKIRKVLNPVTFEYEKAQPVELPCLAEAQKAAGLPEKMKAVVYGEDRGARFAWKAVANNLIYAANRIPEISDTIVDVDNAMRWGFNLEMGPFEAWDAIGLQTSVARMQKEGFKVPPKIQKMLKAGHTAFYKMENGIVFFYDFESESYKEKAVSPHIISLASLKAQDKVVQTSESASLIDLDDGVFCLEFHTKMNSLNQQIVEALHSAREFVDREGIGLVIGNQAGGMPGAFSAGANLADMSTAAKAGRYADIEQLIKSLQYGLQDLRYAPFPVVAAPFGLTLGGGCEVCLAADKIVAHAELYMGQVEIGVGLIPAGGGCLNLMKKCLSALPVVVTGFDLAKFFLPVFMAIAMAKVTTSAADARANGFLGPCDRIVFNRDYLIGEAKKEVVKMVDEGYAPPLKRKIKVLGQAAQGMVNAEVSNMLSGRFISEYDAFLAKKIAYVIGGGDVRDNARVDEDVILTLEREVFMDLLKEEKTLARIDHMLTTGKPLRN